MNIYGKSKVYKNKRKASKSKWTTSFSNDRATSPTPAPYACCPPGRQRKLKNKSPFPTQPTPSTGTTSAPATRPPEKPPVHHKRCLKLLIEDTCLVSAGRLFQSLAPRKEKHFCPFADVFIGSVKSVAVFRWLRELKAEFLVKRLCMYQGRTGQSGYRLGPEGPPQQVPLWAPSMLEENTSDY